MAAGLEGLAGVTSVPQPGGSDRLPDHSDHRIGLISSIMISH